MKQILKYILVYLLFISCQKKETSFSIPIGYEFTINETNILEKDKIIDSIISNYDSLNLSKLPFKALGNLYLSDSINNKDEHQTFSLYDSSELFDIYLSKDWEGKTDCIYYSSYKGYDAQLYNIKDIIIQEPILITSSDIVYNDFNKKLQLDKYFRKNGKENLNDTFKFLLVAFTKKYGKYNFSFKEFSNYNNENKNTSEYNWLKDGVLIQLSYASSKYKNYFKPYAIDNEGKERFFISQEYSDYEMRYLDGTLRIEFKNIRRYKNNILRTEKIQKKEEENIRKQNDRKENNIKRYDDSVKVKKVDAILKNI